MPRTPIVAVVLCLPLLIAGRATVAQAPAGGVEFADTIEQRMLACAGCHGKQGEGSRQNEYYPRIAGKPPEYLYRQLVNFREGRRTYPQMVYMTRYLSDEYLREIANYYAKLAPPFPTPVQSLATKETLARGRQVVENGVPSRNVPACIACHGKALTGMQPGVPGLVGLYPDYINGQLGAWRTKLRHANEPDCMARIAERLSGPDGAAAAAYLASLPGTPQSLPAPDAKTKLPMPCGSQPQ